MIVAVMISFRETNVGNVTSFHSSHDNFVVLMEARILHLKLFINLSSFREVDQLTVVMPCFMPVVHIVCILNQCATTFLKDILDDAVLVHIRYIFKLDDSDRRVSL